MSEALSKLKQELAAELRASWLRGYNDGLTTVVSVFERMPREHYHSSDVVDIIRSMVARLPNA